VLTNVLPMLVSKGFGKLSVPCTGIPSSSTTSPLSSPVLAGSTEVVVFVAPALCVVDTELLPDVSAPRAALPVKVNIRLKMKIKKKGLNECRLEKRV